MSFDVFVSRVSQIFADEGKEPRVRNDRENGLYLAKCGEWRLMLNPNSKHARLYNVRSKFNASVEM